MSGDGQIGDRISQTLSNQNKSSYVTGLYKTVSGAYVFDSNNLNVGQELQSPSSALIYEGNSFSSDPIVAFRQDHHALNDTAKYNAFKPEDKWIREEFSLDGQLLERHEYDHLSKVLTDETIYQYDLNNDEVLAQL